MTMIKKILRQINILFRLYERSINDKDLKTAVEYRHEIMVWMGKLESADK